ncbi:MAG: hypothetical protein IPO21_06765 [Bacteroidales bacterium]|nr:hypothetical protein [Bacteroidales bacterium]
MVKTYFLFFVGIALCLTSFSQESPRNTTVDSLIEVGFGIVENFKNNKLSAVKSLYTDSGFQTKKEFNSFINKDNSLWLSKVVDSLGLPQKSEIDVSGWKINSLGSEAYSYNISYYFKKNNEPFFNTNDHISFNFSSKDGIYKLDGLMVFKENDYILVKNVLEKLAKN